MKFFYAALVGALLGASATLLHLWLFPLGLILGLMANVIGIWAIGRVWRLQRFKFVAAVAWLFVVVQGATVGVGGELLIQGDLAGSLVLLLGTFSLLLAIFLPI
jgi:hypothetical protein